MSKYEEAIDLLQRIERENFNVDEDLKENIQHFLWSLSDDDETEEKIMKLFVYRIHRKTPLFIYGDIRCKGLLIFV